MNKDEAGRDAPFTVCAIAAAAACLAAVAHEALGHGGACLATGGRITQLTSVYFQCEPGGWRIAVFGPIGNLVTALVAWLALRAAPKDRAPGWRLFLVLLFAFSLFWFAGYLLYSAATGEGDNAIVARALVGDPTWRWTVPASVAGVVLYAIGIAGVARASRPLRAPGQRRTSRLWRLSWLAASASACIAAVTYVPDPIGALGQAALEIGAASLPLLVMKPRTRPDAQPEAAAPPIAPGPRWILTGVMVFLAFVLTLGRGLP
jgi:hypothetical protein